MAMHSNNKPDRFRQDFSYLGPSRYAQVARVGESIAGNEG